MRLLAPNLPWRVEGCETCAAFPETGITKDMIDAYIQHHKDVHGWTNEIGWQQTYAWARGEAPEEKEKSKMGWTQVGACPRCGAPIYVPSAWWATTPPPSHHTCTCFGEQQPLTVNTTGTTTDPQQFPLHNHLTDLKHG